MNNPFETIKYLLTRRDLTRAEKQRMKNLLVSYVHTHPVTSGLISPYHFRYATFALASLVVVLGGSIGLTSASYQALPTSKLYPVKIWIEEYQANNQKTPEAIIAFETKRIENRFAEATQLALNQELSTATSALIQSGIEHSRTTIQSVADTLEDTQPELALSAASTLQATFSINGKILAAIEQNTEQAPGPIVLAAQITTQTLALEKTKFEEIVITKSDQSTAALAQERSQEVTALFAAIPEPTPESLSRDEVVLTDTSSQDAAELSLATASPALMSTSSEPESLSRMAEIQTPETTTDEPSLLAVQAAPVPKKSLYVQAQEIAARADEKMDQGFYSEALVLLEQARQLLHEIKLTESLEKEYQLETN